VDGKVIADIDKRIGLGHTPAEVRSSSKQSVNSMKADAGFFGRNPWDRRVAIRTPH
jgi:hypothetical protein